MYEVGSVIDGRYKILRVIGKGGMSVVYLAVNERVNRYWAIKEVRTDIVENNEIVKQGLVAEASFLTKFNHPNLPQIIDIIYNEDSFLIVMDFIEGETLQRLIEKNGAQSETDVVKWAKQLCSVLSYLHSAQPPIIYRDMKPSNIMLKPDGNVVLIDFGTVREFDSEKYADTVCFGTLGYAAPEQFDRNTQSDARTDIYGLGATMYHLVTGRDPCRPPLGIYPIRQWNDALSIELEEIILKCTKLDPNERYQSCADLYNALDNLELQINVLKNVDIHKNEKIIRKNYNEVFEAEVKDSYQNAVRAEVKDSYQDTVGAEVEDSYQDTVGAEVEDSYQDTINADVKDSYKDTVNAEVKDSHQGLIEPGNNNKKWKFVVTMFMILFVVGLIGTIGFGIVLSVTTESTYNDLLLNAQSQTDDKKAVEIYKQAIDIRPTDVRAYSGLLDLYGQDSTLSMDENKVLTEILDENLEQMLKKNGAEFADEFVYPYSQYLFFAYASSNSIDGKVKAKPWLEVVEAYSKDDYNKSRASFLKTLSNSFSNLGKTDATGDSEYSYAKYWNDLLKITSPTLAEDENITVALSEYRFVILEMYNDFDRFADEGVTKDDYDVMMDDIEQGLQNIENSPAYTSNKSRKSYFDMTIKLIRKKIADIKSVYTNYFGGQAGE